MQPTRLVVGARSRTYPIPIPYAKIIPEPIDSDFAADSGVELGINSGIGIGSGIGVGSGIRIGSGNGIDLGI